MGAAALVACDAGAMISEIDIWRSAQLLITRMAPGWFPRATRRAGQMLDRGDGAGWHSWARIRLAIEALQAPRWGEPN